MKLHHLQHFTAIAFEGSLRAAARMLNIAQPAITRSLRELEQELGLPLVQRYSHGVSLTPAGERFLARAKTIMVDIEKAKDEAAQLRGEQTGSVTVGLSPVVEGVILPLVYGKFRRLYPEVRLNILEMVYPAALPMLNDATMDFYAGPSPETTIGNRYHSELLWHKDRIIVARAGHPHAATSHLAQLSTGEWLAFGLRSRTEDELDEVFHTYGLPSPPMKTLVNSIWTLLALIPASDAVAFLPRALLQSDLFREKMIAIPVKERIFGPKIVMIKRAGLPLTPAADYLAELIRKAARNAVARLD